MDGLSDRIEVLGGTLEPKRPADSGTVLLITVPLKDRRDAGSSGPSRCLWRREEGALFGHYQVKLDAAGGAVVAASLKPRSSAIQMLT
jgi:hypothetical protein